MHMRGLLVAAAIVSCAQPASAARVTLTFEPGTYELIDDGPELRSYRSMGLEFAVSGYIQGGVLAVDPFPGRGPGGMGPNRHASTLTVWGFDLRGAGPVKIFYDNNLGPVDIGNTEQFQRFGPYIRPGRFQLISNHHFELDNWEIELFAVPEPATWTLLISGFGLVGAALRRSGRLASARRSALRN
jgi:hypothetical protein